MLRWWSGLWVLVYRVERVLNGGIRHLARARRGRPARLALVLGLDALLVAAVFYALADVGPGARVAARSSVPTTTTAYEVPRPPDLPDSVIGGVVSRRIAARIAPGWDSEVIATFGRTNPEGAPQVFLLVPHDPAPSGMLRPRVKWVPALLPITPNGTVGYLPVRKLSLSITSYRIIVDRSNFDLMVFKHSELIMHVAVGIGTGETPTPVGRFYLTSLLQPPDPDGVYGTYAYGLSGYSETLTEWAGGGVIGMHGTDQPRRIGMPVSHGCLRLRNWAIEKLAPILPLGTPVEIR